MNRAIFQVFCDVLDLLDNFFILWFILGGLKIFKK